MSRIIAATGLLLCVSGLVWVIPATKAWVEHNGLTPIMLRIAVVGPLLFAVGVVTAWKGRSGIAHLRKITPAVRAVLLANGLFIAFCVMELCDGLMRGHGRVFYWTTVLFFPAAAVFYGQILAQRWAWWIARALSALMTLWFVVFLFVIPFGHMKGPGGTIPWWGRIYASAVTMAFASIGGYIFYLLGRNEARAFYSARIQERAS